MVGITYNLAMKHWNIAPDHGTVAAERKRRAPEDRSMIAEIESRLAHLSNPGDGLFLQRFFKTGPGQYGEGDLFRGIRVPALRRLSGAYENIPLEQADRLLMSAYHEDRLLALLILVRRYARADEAGRTGIYTLYLNRTRFINNWDLVDASAAQIVGAYLSDKSPEPLYRLARSRSIWERRIAILATFHFIKGDKFDETIRIAGMLLADREDLIHKAVGWMLREVGKRDLQKEEAFLRAHCRQMPRTMLRYAIERFPEDKRQRYLKGTA
jgi:3-methyladenine DNA glycosylase AlkD